MHRVAAFLRLCVFAPIALAICLLPRAAAAAPDEVIDRVLAVVNGEVITLSDVRTARELGRVQVGDAPDPVRAVLSQLIDRVLVLSEVDRFAPPEPSALTIDAALESVIAHFPTEQAFTETIARLGVDRTYVRELLREDLRIRAYLDQRFTANSPADQRTMVDEWVNGLRRRAEVADLYTPPLTESQRETAGSARD